MIGQSVVIEVGPELRTVLVGLLALAGSWLGGRRARKELRPNGGSSVRDAIDRIEQRQIRTDARLDAAGIPDVSIPATPIPPPAAGE